MISEGLFVELSDWGLVGADWVFLGDVDGEIAAESVHLIFSE